MTQDASGGFQFLDPRFALIGRQSGTKQCLSLKGIGRCINLLRRRRQGQVQRLYSIHQRRQTDGRVVIFIG